MADKTTQTVEEGTTIKTEQAESTLHKLGASLDKGFGIAKQAVLQTLGKVEGTHESKDFEDALKRLHLANETFMKFMTLTKALWEEFPTIDNPAWNFINLEIANAIKLEQRYKLAVLDHDNRQQQFKALTDKHDKEKETIDQSKLTDAKEKFDKANTEYENIKKELLSSIKLVDDRKLQRLDEAVSSASCLLKKMRPEAWMEDSSKEKEIFPETGDSLPKLEKQPEIRDVGRTDLIKDKDFPKEKELERDPKLEDQERRGMGIKKDIPGMGIKKDISGMGIQKDITKDKEIERDPKLEQEDRGQLGIKKEMSKEKTKELERDPDPYDHRGIPSMF